MCSSDLAVEEIHHEQVVRRTEVTALEIGAAIPANDFQMEISSDARHIY